jgi:periplasmic copper chaperone A
VTHLRPVLALALLGLLPQFARAAESSNARQFPTITVIEPWARATPPGMTMTAAYLSITNRGPRPDVLVSASSPAAADVDLHRSVVQGGMSRMQPAGAVTIAPGSTLRIEPTGLHMMLVGVAAPLLPGASLPLTLRFRDAGEITVQVAIRPVSATSGLDHGH